MLLSFYLKQKLTISFIVLPMLWLTACAFNGDTSIPFAPPPFNGDRTPQAMVQGDTYPWHLEGNRFEPNITPGESFLHLDGLMKGDYRISGTLEIPNAQNTGGLYVQGPVGTHQFIKISVHPDSETCTLNHSNKLWTAPLKTATNYFFEMVIDMGHLTLQINQQPIVQDIVFEQGCSLSFLSIGHDEAAAKVSFLNWLIQSSAPTLAPVIYREDRATASE